MNSIPLMVALVLVALTPGISQALAQSNPDATAKIRADAKLVMDVLPDRMPGAENDTRARVELGRKLYFEKNSR